MNIALESKEGWGMEKGNEGAGLFLVYLIEVNISI